MNFSPPWLWCGLLSLSMAAFSEAAELKRYEAVEPAMGTRFLIVCYAKNQQAAGGACRQAFERIQRLNKILSDYDRESEISRLGQTSPHSEPVPASRELTFVLKHAERISQASGGAFDVTVGPLSKLWRRARRRKELPDANRLLAALAAVGYQGLELDVDRQAVRLRKSGMRLDLGGIAKGYAADEALRVLREHGITRALINAGGDIVAGDPPPGRAHWSVGVAPLRQGSEPSRFLGLTNGAVATSGDLWQYVEVDGQRYSHIVDPRTGVGLTRRSVVTVVAPSGILADAWASAFAVLRPGDALELAQSQPAVETLIQWMDDDQLRQNESSGLARLGVELPVGDPHQKK